MGRPTREVIEELIARMESFTLDVEENARLWREQLADENVREALSDIEMAARKLGDLIGRLAPPAVE